jgi:hypothetical protein
MGQPGSKSECGRYNSKNNSKNRAASDVGLHERPPTYRCANLTTNDNRSPVRRAPITTQPAAGYEDV